MRPGTLRDQEKVLETYAEVLRLLKETTPLFDIQRSSKWTATRKAYLEIFPTCAVCNGTLFPEVHHIVPYHVDPALELEVGNLITLCDNPARRCHFMVGHLGDWRSWNVQVRRTAATLNSLIRTRPRKPT